MRSAAGPAAHAPPPGETAQRASAAEVLGQVAAGRWEGRGRAAGFSNVMNHWNPHHVQLSSLRPFPTHWSGITGEAASESSDSCLWMTEQTNPTQKTEGARPCLHPGAALLPCAPPLCTGAQLPCGIRAAAPPSHGSVLCADQWGCGAQRFVSPSQGAAVKPSGGVTNTTLD